LAGKRAKRADHDGRLALRNWLLQVVSVRAQAPEWEFWDQLCAEVGAWLEEVDDERVYGQLKRLWPAAWGSPGAPPRPRALVPGAGAERGAELAPLAEMPLTELGTEWLDRLDQWAGVEGVILTPYEIRRRAGCSRQRAEQVFDLYLEHLRTHHRIGAVDLLAIEAQCIAQRIESMHGADLDPEARLKLLQAQSKNIELRARLAAFGGRANPLPLPAGEIVLPAAAYDEARALSADTKGS
jgi:hypothetical protein